MTSDELAERVDTIGRVRDLLDMPRDEITEARQIDYELADLSSDLLSVLDDVAEGLAAVRVGQWGGIRDVVEKRVGQDTARTLDAVRDLHLRREGEE